jgi:hypothetical protein
MATDKIVNINELSPQGYWKPANTVNAVSPDNVTHAQLRYSDFSASYVVQGSIVSGENSTFKFSIADNLATELFKLYTSTDGTTYTVDKRFGGDNGVKLFGATDLSGLVTLTTAQNISGTKTLTGNANIVVSSGSDITVQAGGDITLADAPTASTDAVNKAYVDANTFKSCVFWIDAFYLDGLTALSYRRIFNNTGVTPTLAYGNNSLNETGLSVTFNRTSAAWDIVTTHLSSNDDFASYPAGFFYIDSTINQASSATGTILTFGVDYNRAAQSITYHYYDMLTADTWGRTGSDPNKYLVTDVGSITLGTAVALTDLRKNARIELRFYD